MFMVCGSLDSNLGASVSPLMTGVMPWAAYLSSNGLALTPPLTMELLHGYQASPDDLVRGLLNIAKPHCHDTS